MKASALIFLGVLLSVPMATKAVEQTTDPQEACEADVYALCGEAIPDQDRITACLRAHWKKVSKDCRKVMANYGRNHSSAHPDKDN
jgi:hypothetical protein